MPPKKMKIGGVIVSEDLGMITVQGAPQHPGIAGAILAAIGAIGLSVEFISCGPDLGGGASISICVPMARFDEAYEQIERVAEEIQAQKLATKEDLCALAVFGPHFREIPNIASQIFNALAAAGINILAISTSISSVACVIEQEKLTEGLGSLRVKFEIP